MPAGCILIPDPQDPTCCNIPRCNPIPNPSSSPLPSGQTPAPYTITGVPAEFTGFGNTSPAPTIPFNQNPMTNGPTPPPTYPPNYTGNTANPPTFAPSPRPTYPPNFTGNTANPPTYPPNFTYRPPQPTGNTNTFEKKDTF